jgi:hypothetical protein
MVQAASHGSLIPQSDFNTRPGHVKLTVEKIALGQILLRVLRFLSSILFQQCSILTN